VANPSRTAEVEVLIREIQRYLSLVAALRKPPEPPGADAEKKRR
jgi:hypothetical protein